MKNQTRWLPLWLLIPAALYILGIVHGNPRPVYSPSTEQQAWLNPQTIYHPDEFAYAGIAYRMLVTHDWNPHYYHNPPLNIYTNTGIFAAMGAEHWPHNTTYGDREIAPFALYVTARYLSALYTLLTVVFTYATGRIAFGKRAGMVAAALVALSPLIVQHAHYATPNAETTMLSTASLMMGIAILKNRLPPWMPLSVGYALAGLLVGLTMAARYNAVAVGLVTGLAMLTVWRRHRRWLPVLVGMGMMPAGFVLAVPGIVIDPAEVIDQMRGILDWYQHQGGGPGFSAAPGLPSLMVHWRYVILMAVGPVTALVALAGVILTLRQWRSARWPDAWIGATLALYLIVYSGLALRGPRLQANLLFPLIIPIGLLAGYAVDQGWQRHPRARVFWLLMVLMLAWPAWLAVSFTHRIDTLDNRLKAQAWIYEHIPRQTQVHLLGAYNVPLDPLDYTVSQTYLYGMTPTEIAATDAPVIVYSDAGPWVTLRDTSSDAAPLVNLENEVRDVLANNWIELARFKRMDWPLAKVSPDDVSYWHQMEIVIYCHPTNCPVGN